MPDDELLKGACTVDSVTVRSLRIKRASPVYVASVAPEVDSENIVVLSFGVGEVIPHRPAQCVLPAIALWLCKANRFGVYLHDDLLRGVLGKIKGSGFVCTCLWRRYEEVALRRQYSCP